MKNVKKLLGIVLILTLVMSIGISSAFAAGTPGITIKPNNSIDSTESLEITYTYYKILSASIDTDPTVGDTGEITNEGVVAYYVEDSAQATALQGTGVFVVTKVDGQDKWYVELAEGKGINDIVEAFDNAEFLENFQKEEYTKPSNVNEAVLPNITAGYYFIKSSLGTEVIIQTLSPVVINEKNNYPSIEKTDDLEYMAIDDLITYTVTVTIPASVAEKDIVIYDTITEGLTLNTDVTVSGAVSEPAYTSATFIENTDYSASDNEKQYTLTIPAATVIANKDRTLIFTYTAKMNEKAVVLEKEHNKAYLSYDKYTTVEVDTDVMTLAVDIQKVDATDETTILAGAKFKLYDAKTEGNEVAVVALVPSSITQDDGIVVNMYRVAKEDETGVEMEGGTFRIEGLDAKEYYLQETAAPTGYNLSEARHAINVTESTAPATTVENEKTVTHIDYDITNTKGTELPSTGGIGTTIFYVIGGLLVVGAGVVLVSRRKSQDD